MPLAAKRHSACKKDKKDHKHNVSVFLMDENDNHDYIHSVHIGVDYLELKTLLPLTLLLIVFFSGKTIQWMQM